MGRVGIQRREDRLASTLCLVLQLSRSQSLGEATPEPVKSVVRHFEYPADVRRLPLVQKEIGFRGVTVLAVYALEKTQSHERVQEVARGSRVETHSILNAFEILRTPCKFGEEFHFDGTQQCLRSPETQTDLHNVIRRRMRRHRTSFLLY